MADETSDVTIQIATRDTITQFHSLPSPGEGLFVFETGPSFKAMHPNIHQQQQHHQKSYHNQHRHFMDDGAEEHGCSSVYAISNPYEQQHLGPITHQLFHQAHHFHAIEEQANQRLLPRLDQRFGHAHPHPPPFFHVNFRLGLNENSGTHEVPSILTHPQSQRGPFFLGNRPDSSGMPQCWNLQQDSCAAKEPIWKPLSRCEVESELSSGSREERAEKNKCEEAQLLQRDHRYGLFGELEAVYGLAKTSEANRQAASGSALTGENSPTDGGITAFGLSQGQNLNTNVGGVNAPTGADHGSETSVGLEEHSLDKKRKKRKREVKEEFSRMACFFESLVKKVMDHQEILHSKFLEVVERLDEERRKNEEAWRQQEAAKRNREIVSRARERALASNREALIVSYLEKITGQIISLPPRPPLLLETEARVEPVEPASNDTNVRWPSAEIEALIQVRSSLDIKFQEPGSKGPLWDEVSSLMACMGYQRSARRCRQKWDNINKYFKRAKETGKRRSQQSRTCAYFDQLDQLYSGIPMVPPPPIRPYNNSESKTQKVVDSDFLEAIMSEKELLTSHINFCSSYKGIETGSPKLDSDATVGAFRSRK